MKRICYILRNFIKKLFDNKTEFNLSDRLRQYYKSKSNEEIVSLIKKSVELEKEYAYDACPNGLLGINPGQFAEYVEYVADRRLERIGLTKIYNKENPFLWLSESTDLRKKKNFFETRVTEYQVGGMLEWQD